MRCFRDVDAETHERANRERIRRAATGFPIVNDAPRATASDRELRDGFIQRRTRLIDLHAPSRPDAFAFFARIDFVETAVFRIRQPRFRVLRRMNGSGRIAAATQRLNI